MTWRNPLFTPSSAVTGVRIAARSKSVKHDAMAVHLTLGRDLMTKLGFTVGEKVRLWVGDGPNAGWVRLTLPDATGGAVFTVGTGGGTQRLSGGLVQFSARYLQGAAVVEKMTAIDAEHRVGGGGLDVRLPEGWVARLRDLKAYRICGPLTDADLAALAHSPGGMLEASELAEKVIEEPTPEKVADVLAAERAAIEATGLYSAPAEAVTAPVEIEPEPAAAPESEAAPNCKTGANYAEAMPAVDSQPQKAKPPASSPTKFATRNPPPLGKAEHAPKRNLWTDAEVVTLKRMWRDGATDAALLAALPKRPWGAIAYKANSLNLGVRPIVDRRGTDEATPKRPDPKPRVAVHAPATADKPVKRVATVVEERRLPSRRPAGEAPPTEYLGHGTTVIQAAAWMRAQGVSVVMVPTRGTVVANGQDMTPRQFVAYANSERIKRNLPATFTADDRTDRITASGSGGSSLTNMGA